MPKGKKKLSCPKCGSSHTTRSGYRWVRGKRRQRMQCQGCGLYFVPGAATATKQGGK